MNDLSANAEQLHGTSGQYQDVADQVGKIYQVLTEKLHAEGACWGNDVPGKVFGDKYVASALSVLSQMDNTNEGIQSMVDGICSWAKNYMNASDAAQSSAQQITNNISGVHAGVSEAGG